MQCLGGNVLYIIRMLLISLLFLPLFVKGETLYVIGHKGSFNLDQKKQFLADYYLLKRKKNAKGTRVIPVNLPLAHPVRMQFSHSILEYSPVVLGEYWDRMSFRGIRPPVVQKSEQAVFLFVSRVEGAIGYVRIKPKNNEAVDVLGEISL
jgi:hypothetical protein